MPELRTRRFHRFHEAQRPQSALTTGAGDDDPRGWRATKWLPLASLGGIAVAFSLAYLLSAGFRAGLGELAGMLARGDSAALRDYILSFGPWAPVASLLLMVIQALVPPIPSFFVIFANGLAFGAVWGGLLSVAGGTVAALVSFTIARALGRGPVEALVGRAGLASADGWFARWGGWTILLARLLPGVPVDAISYAAGLTSMAPRRFLAASVIGMLPQTLLYAYLGEHAPQYLWVMCAATVVVLSGGTLVALFLKRRNKAAQP